MSDSLRTDGSRAHDTASGSDRDAKIEQLLLVGLDHYFAARYELAINVWTRALFLDRSHARARAYIERARSALAEGQRESEELLQNGVAAFHRGDGEEARRLLQAAIDGGAPSEEALAVLRCDPAARVAHFCDDRHALGSDSHRDFVDLIRALNRVGCIDDEIQKYLDHPRRVRSNGRNVVVLPDDSSSISNLRCSHAQG